MPHFLHRLYNVVFTIMLHLLIFSLRVSKINRETNFFVENVELYILFNFFSKCSNQSDKFYFLLLDLALSCTIFSK